MCAYGKKSSSKNRQKKKTFYKPLHVLRTNVEKWPRNDKSIVPSVCSDNGDKLMMVIGYLEIFDELVEPLNAK